MILSKSTSSLTDIELIAKYKRDGNQRWVGELFNRYAHLVFGVCMKYYKNEVFAQDATMGVFESLMKLLKQHEIDHFKAWLYRVTKNYCLMDLRKKKKEFNGSMVETVDETSHHLDEKMVLESLLDQLEEAISTLNEDQQQCVRLFFLEKKSYNQIVALTGINLKSVKSNIQNGKRNLKMKLTKVS